MPHVFKTPKGESLVILTEAEYRMLLPPSRLPSEPQPPPTFVLEAIDGGMTPLKALRLWRGVSQKSIAEKTGLSNAFLSRVERGRKPLGGKAQSVVAKALDVPEAWLRAQPD